MQGDGNKLEAILPLCVTISSQVPQMFSLTLARRGRCELTGQCCLVFFPSLFYRFLPPTSSQREHAKGPSLAPWNKDHGGTQTCTPGLETLEYWSRSLVRSVQASLTVPLVEILNMM